MPDTTNSTHAHYGTETEGPLSVFGAIPDERRSRLLTTNDAPECEELLALMSSLYGARSVYEDLEDDITAIEAVLVGLRKAKEDVAATINKYEGAVHPIRSIPDDILLYIFEWCVVLDGDHDDTDSLLLTYSPWRLSQVSRRWRTLALASPRVWSVIHISSENSPLTTRKLDNLSLLLHRSADCDLTLKISHYLEDDDIFIKECLSRLMPTVKRWKSLYLTIHYTLLAPFTGYTFDRLKDVSFDLRHDSRPNAPALDAIYWVTPNLTHVVLNGPVIGLSWDQITTYSCDEWGLKHLAKLNSAEHVSLHSIETEALRREVTNLSSSGISLPLPVPALHYISLEQWGNSNLQELSELFVLASSSTLIILFRQHKSPFPTFHGSIHRIQNLSIDTLPGLESISEELIAFLGECTSVTALYLDARCTRREVLKALRKSSMLPKLTSLRIDSEMLRVCPRAVIALVEARSHLREAAKLTELRLVSIEPETWPNGQWKTSARATKEVLERWEVIRTVVKVLDVEENSFLY